MPPATTIIIDRPHTPTSPHPTTSVRATGAALARYRLPTPAPTTAGMTRRQAAELARIRERHGRTIVHRRADGTLAVGVLGRRALACEAPLLLVMRPDGTIAARVRPEKARPADYDRP